MTLLFEDVPVGLPADKWDGYRVSRDNILQFVHEQGNRDFVVLTGDVHMNAVGDLQLNFDDPSSVTVGTEFVGTSISSFGDGVPETIDDPDPLNPHFKYVNRNQRGYVRCEVTPELWRADFRAVDTVSAPTSAIRTIDSFVIEQGRPGVQRA